MLITQYCAHKPSPATCEKSGIVLHPCQSSKVVNKEPWQGPKEIHEHRKNTQRTKDSTHLPFLL
ncbi:unnamed protein product [Prunus brigantina]